MTGISVVIPTRNCRVLLSETIATLVAQTCVDWELIVVDDGSTDDTRRFARALRLQLRACLAAPWLVTSPMTRRPLWWGIKKCILRVTTA